MPRDVDLLLRDVRNAASDAIRYAEGHTDGTFASMPSLDRDRYRALKNAIMELGEAITPLPEAIRTRNADIDWQGLSGLRDIVDHQFFRLDLVRLWPVVRTELPAVVRAMEADLSRLGPPEP